MTKRALMAMRDGEAGKRALCVLRLLSRGGTAQAFRTAQEQWHTPQQWHTLRGIAPDDASQDRARPWGLKIRLQRLSGGAMGMG
jgi:hypothetical protein